MPKGSLGSKSEVRLGPFIGGLNTRSISSIMDDREVSLLNNFEVDVSGALISRPPIIDTESPGVLTSSRMVILGSDRFSGTNYIFGSNVDGIFYLVPGSGWTLITNTFVATSMVRYADKIWFLSIGDATDSMGYWDPSGGWVAISGTDQTNLNTLMGSNRGGGNLVVYKERLWIVPGDATVGRTTNTTRLIFTNPTPTQWNMTGQVFSTTNFIDVNFGDGERLVDLAVYQDNLVLFKEDSSYMLTYSNVITEATITKINDYIGVKDRHCLVDFEQSLYLLHEHTVYEISNFNFTAINTKVIFESDEDIPFVGSTRTERYFLSIVGDRLICRFTDNIYVYHLRTKTWSTWTSQNANLHNFGPAHAIVWTGSQEFPGGLQYYAGSCLSNKNDIFIITDADENVTTAGEKYGSTQVTILCTFESKTYTFDNSHRFKRLLWWGADISTSSDVAAAVIITTNLFSTTWGTLNSGNILWADLDTWGDPQSSAIIEDTNIDVTSSAYDFRFVKFLKSLRFRQVIFRIVLTTDGTISVGPSKLYQIIPVIAVKANVPLQVNT